MSQHTYTTVQYRVGEVRDYGIAGFVVWRRRRESVLHGPLGCRSDAIGPSGCGDRDWIALSLEVLTVPPRPWWGPAARHRRQPSAGKAGPASSLPRARDPSAQRDGEEDANFRRFKPGPQCAAWYFHSAPPALPILASPRLYTRSLQGQAVCFSSDKKHFGFSRESELSPPSAARENKSARLECGRRHRVAAWPGRALWMKDAVVKAEAR